MNWDVFNFNGKVCGELIIILSNDLLGGEVIYKVFKFTHGHPYRTWESPHHLKFMEKYYKVIDRRNNA